MPDVDLYIYSNDQAGGFAGLRSATEMSKR